MPIVYKDCEIPGTIAEYLCNPCLTTEKGRVSGIAYINKSLKDQIDAESETPGVKNIESLAWWEEQIELNLIKVIPLVRGTYDGGTSNMVSGFGRINEIKSNKTHVVVVNDYNHTGNDVFWQEMENTAMNHILAWRTDKELRVATDVLESIEAKDAVEEDLNSAVLWQITNTWRQNGPKMNVPIYNLGEVANVFQCIEEITPPTP
ncbi:MAG: hypothetical protein LBQ74_13040 [Prevotella sp.]|jgi:hypothetical protein|nr:hypothetical protein [Prevotella sp.]